MDDGRRWRTARLGGLVRALCLGVLALALAACGGAADGGPAVRISEGAAFAPARAPAFVEITTDVDGAQWRKAESPLDRFPGKDAVLGDLRQELNADNLSWERDVKPALGDAVYLVWLDFANGGDDVVGFTKPADRRKFERVLESGDEPTVHRELDGWVVFSDRASLLDRFQDARTGGSLADEDRFEEATDELPEDSIVRAYLNGEEVQRAVDASLAQGGAPASLTRTYGRLETLGAAVVAKGDGVMLKADVATASAPAAEPYTPELPSVVPSGALAYVSFGTLEEGFRRALRVLEENDPALAAQRGQAEQVLGLTLEDDVLPLFGKEGGIAVYRVKQTPAVALFLAVSDEGKARRVLDRFGALAKLADGATTRRFTVEGVEARELRFRRDDVSLLTVVSRNRLIVTSSEAVLRDVLDGGRTLADDNGFKRAREAAGLPGETTGFLYLALQRGVPFVLDYAEREGEQIAPEARRNVRPLRSLLLFAEQDGDDQTLTGFVELE